MFRDITLKEAQTIEFDLFLVFRKLCRENGLTCWLSGGTLLGAARHKGFIPWDDDVDVMMPRADYDKLIGMTFDLPERYKLFCCEHDDRFFAPFAKFCDMRYRLCYEAHRDETSIGMFIDVFPVETLPDGKLKRKLYFKRMALLSALGNAARRSRVTKDEKHRRLKQLIGPIARLRPVSWYMRRMNAIARGYIGKRTAHAGVTMVTHYGERECMPREVFEGSAALPFNGVSCEVPAGWDAYLTSLYGDYMQLPPEDKRVSEHTLFTIEARE